MVWKLRFKSFFSLRDDFGNLLDSFGSILNGLIGVLFYTFRILCYGLRKYKDYVDRKRTGKKFKDKNMEIWE